MRLIIDAERPVALWLPLRIVQTVLRGSPKILACSSSVRKPAASTVSASSLILDNWRAFISALTKSPLAPYLRKGFELVHADGRGERRCAVLDFFEP